MENIFDVFGYKSIQLWNIFQNYMKEILNQILIDYSSENLILFNIIELESINIWCIKWFSNRKRKNRKIYCRVRKNISEKYYL